MLNAVLNTLFILTFTTMIQVACHHTESVQNKSPQNVPLWHVDFFELKAVETMRGQKKLFYFLNLEEYKLGGLLQNKSYYQK